VNISVERGNVILELEMTNDEASQLKGLLFRANWSHFEWAESIVDALEDFVEVDTTISDGEVARV
jgi:hypothetical protein